MTDARILVVNAGSSSLKLRVLGPNDEAELAADFGAAGGRFDPDEVEAALADVGRIDAVGHRVVHGGELFTNAVLIAGDVGRRLASLASLAPLHQTPALEALDVVAAMLPEVPQIACFDTAFHASIPPAAATYALPERWRTRYALKRYGFHGLSHAYAARRAAEMLDRAIEELRIVTCHLGAGASLTAVLGGASVDTTMGFTPLEGLVMATRSGTIDPGIVPWLLQHAGHEVGEISEALERRSGLRGLAGTADMREVIARAEAGEHDAGLALDVYLHRLCGSIAAMAASMQGVDVLVFTGRIGERAPVIRRRVVDALHWLGADLDDERNRAAEPDADIGAPSARIRTVVVESREDLEIARQVRTLLASA